VPPRYHHSCSRSSALPRGRRWRWYAGAISWGIRRRGAVGGGASRRAVPSGRRRRIRRRQCDLGRHGAGSLGDEVQRDAQQLLKLEALGYADVLDVADGGVLAGVLAGGGAAERGGEPGLDLEEPGVGEVAGEGAEVRHGFLDVLGAGVDALVQDVVVLDGVELVVRERGHGHAHLGRHVHEQLGQPARRDRRLRLALWVVLERVHAHLGEQRLVARLLEVSGAAGGVGDGPHGGRGGDKEDGKEEVRDGASHSHGASRRAGGDGVCVCVSPPLWSVVPGDGDERKGTTRTGLYTCYLASLLELQAVKLGRFSPWSMTCSPPGMHAWLAAAIGE
jgi:hypothetical protein